MKKRKNDGGPMHPKRVEVRVVEPGHTVMTHKGGMSMRDYYAGQALAGFIVDHWNHYEMTPDKLAHHCWEIAESMIAERRSRYGKEAS